MSVLQFTARETIPKIVREAREAFASDKTRPEAFRRQQLFNLAKLVDENEAQLCAAVEKDLRKPPAETSLMENGMILSDITLTLKNLSKWMKPQYVDAPLVNKFDNPQIRYEPLGVVLIIGAWNYPIQLTLVPLVGAIAAGNCVVIKPSELSPHTAQLIAELIPRYLDTTCFKVINGAVAETTAVLEEKFDHILYTGSGNVAKIVMAAAAKHLTPVTLELGGKSPAIVDKNVDLNVAGRRIAWGRFVNAGQTCIAPDYVLCPRELQPQLIKSIGDAVKEFYGGSPKDSRDFSRIVNVNHFNRVKNLLKDGKVALGGEVDEKELFIAPTVLTDVNPDSSLMQNEIFGPLLPIVDCDSIEAAIKFVNNRDKPLSLYVFSSNKRVIEEVLNRTSSGGAVANDCLMHAGVHSLPFGGVGPSGLGAYHGKFSFDLFSHKKAVLVKDLSLESVNALRYPPYTEKKLSWLKWLVLKKPSQSSSWLVKLLVVIPVIVVSALIYSRL